MNQTMPTALVTGGSRGIGRCIAETLARKGMQVYLTYASKIADAETTVTTIQQAGGHARAFRLNVENSTEVVNFFQTHIKPLEQFSLLVNNAGIVKDGFLIRMKESDFDQVIDVNLRGAFYCLREAAKIMSKQRAGSIINISSVVGQMGNPGQANYAAAKAGLIGLTKSAAKELASRNITVNAIAPGFIETDMTSSLPEDVKAAYLAHIPLKRLGLAQEVADAVAFLGSQKAAYITGQVLAINGGMYC